MSQSEVVGLKEDDAIASRPMSANINNLDLNKAEDVTGELKAKHSQSLTFNVEMSNSELNSGKHKGKCSRAHHLCGWHRVI